MGCVAPSPSSKSFLANAAHELKTPVAILKSTCNPYCNVRAPPRSIAPDWKQALVDMARLEKLLHSMLRLARAEQWAAGSIRRDLEAVDVGATCQSAIERLPPSSRTPHEIQFSTNGATPMRADPDDLELVWANLLENAIRFSPAGENVQIRLRASEIRQHRGGR